MDAAPTRLECVRSGALLSPFQCSATCPEFNLRAVHHCERWVVDLVVAYGFTSRIEIAEALGVSEETLKSIEERAQAKVRRRLPIHIKREVA